MAQPFVGQIISVGFNFAPTGWFLCDGQLLPIADYQVLYTLIGTTYGGNGTTNFAVPNLCGRVPLSMGQGPSLSNYVIGQNAGAENVTLNTNQIGAHTHTLVASSQTGTAVTPASNLVLAVSNQPAANLYGPVADTTALSPASIGTAGSNLPHENQQPYQTLNYIICWAGIYPQQS